jgi:hypothetical protein
MRVLVVERRSRATGEKQKAGRRLDVNRRCIGHVVGFFGTRLNPGDDGHF